MVVQPLLLQQLRQVALAAAGLLQLGSLVLEPDLDLIVVESELGGEGAAPLLRQVAVGVELVLQPVELVRGEGSPGPLVLTREVLLLLLDFLRLLSFRNGQTLELTACGSSRSELRG